ncbi:MAG: peptide-methionine (R)-S-oxide reductase MsrB [Acidimicrobiales bacterium]
MSTELDKVEKTEAEWRAQLGPERYKVLRQAHTERAFSGGYVHAKEDGTYRCGACGAQLFDSSAKFESGTGWPSFTEPAVAANVELVDDTSHGIARTEVLCRRCRSHLGHVFDDGPGPTGKRWCMNSLALDLDPSASH